VSNKTKDPKQDSQNHLRSPTKCMPEGRRTLFLLIKYEEFFVDEFPSFFSATLDCKMLELLSGVV